jgi:hypothetical protein
MFKDKFEKIADTFFSKSFFDELRGVAECFKTKHHFTIRRTLFRATIVNPPSSHELKTFRKGGKNLVTKCKQTKESSDQNLQANHCNQGNQPQVSTKFNLNQTWHG